jgi:hypothetical protein
MPYLRIYKNRPNAIFTHSVLKGDDLYEVNIVSGEKMRWRYITKVDPKAYQVSGALLTKPSPKMISIFQRMLQPPIKESKFIDFQQWLNESRDKDYLAWRRNNVTLRGIKELGKENQVYGSFGKGLYSVPLGNKSMAREYGGLYYLVNAKPKNPKIVQNLNDAKMLIQKLINDFCLEKGIKYSRSFFEENTSMEKEMLNLGYDGLIIKGREMVNYTPENVKYYRTENELYNCFVRETTQSESFIKKLNIGVNESLTNEKSVWRSASQEWLKQFIDKGGVIDHGDRFISFSFDPESGGQDNFGGSEIIIEFNEKKLLRQGEKQGLGEVRYTAEWMEEHPDVCGYITGYKTQEEYLEDRSDDDNFPDAKQWKDEYWEANIEDYEQEQEIVLKQLKDEEGLIKEIVFNKPADISLINKLKRRGIPYRMGVGLENDPQKKLQFELFQ